MIPNTPLSKPESVAKPDSVNLALIVERISQINTDFGRHEERLESYEKRLRAVELQSHRRAVSINHLERFVWILVAAGVGLLTYFFRI